MDDDGMVLTLDFTQEDMPWLPTHSLPDQIWQSLYIGRGL